MVIKYLLKFSLCEFTETMGRQKLTWKTTFLENGSILSICTPFLYQLSFPKFSGIVFWTMHRSWTWLPSHTNIFSSLVPILWNNETKPYTLSSLTNKSVWLVLVVGSLKFIPKLKDPHMLYRCKVYYGYVTSIPSISIW